MIRLKINIDTAFSGWEKAFPRMKGKIKQAAAYAFLRAKKPPSFRLRAFEIGIILTDDRNVKALNKTYRGKNKPTNVLSFPQMNLQDFRRSSLNIFPSGSKIPLGDIVLAFQTIDKERLKQKKSLENHVIHLIVHGTLHLLGYDHEKLKDAESMEKLECDILAALGYPDPYNESPVKKIRR